MNEEPTREDDERFHLRHMQYYLQFAQTYASDNEALKADQIDIMQALKVAYEFIHLESVSDSLSTSFVNAVAKFARFLGFRGDLNGRVEWGKRALEVAELLGDKLMIAELCASTIAWRFLQEGNHEQAKVYSERGLQVALQCNAPRWAGEASRSLSGIARDKLQAQEAQHWAEQAMMYARQINHQGLEQGANMDLAYAAILNHDYRKAENLLRELLEIHIKQNDTERIANYYGGVAMTILNLGRNDEAQEMYEKELVIGQSLESDVIMGEAEFGLAKLAEIRGDNNQAEILKSKARRRFRLAGITRPGRAEQFVFITSKSTQE